MVGPIGPSTVRSIKRLVRFSRKPLSSVAPRSEFAVWRQVAASFVPRLGLSLRELSKFTISPRFPSLAHSQLSTGTSPSNGSFGPASAAARSNDPRPYVCRLVPEYYSPIRFLAPRRPEFRFRLYPYLPCGALGRPFPIFGRPVHPRDGSRRLRPGGSPHALQSPPRGVRTALQSFRSWLQLCLGRIRLSPSCPFRLCTTCLHFGQ